jgi:hypothetical protein
MLPTTWQTRFRRKKSSAEIRRLQGTASLSALAYMPFEKMLLVARRGYIISR